MIYVERNGVREQDFVNLLADTKTRTLNSIVNQRLKPKSGVEFQDFVYASMCDAARRTPFDGDVKQTGAHGFPDIVARRYFGVEVKMTIGDKWVSVGNSVMESTRAEDVERIYMFFGRFGKTVEIKYRPYQECLSDVSVTHSPRYLIDMDLSDGDSIFDKMDISYDELRGNLNPIRAFKDYYRKQLGEGEELWWLEGAETPVSPIIRTFRSLTKEEQLEFQVDSMILFPEIFGSSRSKFERPAAYLMTQYNAICPNVRDVFTAGGRKEIIVAGQPTIVSQMRKRLFDLSPYIHKRLTILGEEKLRYYWRVEEVSADHMKDWRRLVRERESVSMNEKSAVDIFESYPYEKTSKKLPGKKSTIQEKTGPTFEVSKVLADVKDWFKKHKV